MRARPRAGTSRLYGPQVGFACARHVQGRRLHPRRASRRVSREVSTSAGRDTIVGAIVKRRAGAAGTASRSWPRASPSAFWDDVFSSNESLGRDSFGNVRLADVPLGTSCATRCAPGSTRSASTPSFLAKDIGYELRCAKPVPFDVDYTRTLGFGAVRYLVDGGSGALIALEGGRVRPLALEDLLDPKTGRIRTRQVDLTTEAYRVARDYMVYLEPADFTDASRLAALAAQTKLDAPAFRAEFADVALP